MCGNHVYMNVYIQLFPQNSNISTWRREAQETQEDKEINKAQEAHKN